jgi:vacuolar-type H+-ATPase subunit H
VQLGHASILGGDLLAVRPCECEDRVNCTPLHEREESNVSDGALRRRRRAWPLLAVLAIGVAGVAWSGCGGGNDSSTGAAQEGIENGLEEAKQGVEKGKEEAEKGIETAKEEAEKGNQAAQKGIEKGKEEAEKGVEKGKEEAEKGIREAERYAP